jgi:hypothetical protein
MYMYVCMYKLSNISNRNVWQLVLTCDAVFMSS